jgi:hypothetical protein
MTVYKMLLKRRVSIEFPAVAKLPLWCRCTDVRNVALIGCHPAASRPRKLGKGPSSRPNPNADSCDVNSIRTTTDIRIALHNTQSPFSASTLDFTWSHYEAALCIADEMRPLGLAATASTALLTGATYVSTLKPPVLPLIVRNPYLSTWLGNAREEPWHKWPIFWTGAEVRCLNSILPLRHADSATRRLALAF